MNDQSEPCLVAKPNRRRLLFWIVVFALFVVGGYWMTGAPHEEGRFGLSKATWGWICIAFFGAGLLMFLKMFMQRCPTLVADREGLTIKLFGARPFGPIFWRELRDVGFRNVGVWPSRQQFLVIHLSDPETVFTRIGHSPWWLSGMKSFRKPITIPEISVDRKIADLRQELVQAWSQGVQN